MSSSQDKHRKDRRDAPQIGATAGSAQILECLPVALALPSPLGIRVGAGDADLAVDRPAVDGLPVRRRSPIDRAAAEVDRDIETLRVFKREQEPLAESKTAAETLQRSKPPAYLHLRERRADPSADGFRVRAGRREKRPPQIPTDERASRPRRAISAASEADAGPRSRAKVAASVRIVRRVGMGKGSRNVIALMSG